MKPHLWNARWRLTVAVLGLLLLPLVAEAQTALVEEPAFRRFDRELKAALEAGDPAVLALLVKFPLRLNHDDGSVVLLANPRALLSSFPEVFSPALRRKVLETKVDDYIEKSSQIGYQGGVIWVEELPLEGEASSFRITVVNLEDSKPDASAAKSLRVSFVCETIKHRVVIEDRFGDKVAHYRVWNKPKSPLEAPDLEIVDGVADIEGRGACAARYWEFQAGSATIRASELGCTAGNESEGATGELVVTKSDGTEQSWYCF